MVGARFQLSIRVNRDSKVETFWARFRLWDRVITIPKSKWFGPSFGSEIRVNHDYKVERWRQLSALDSCIAIPKSNGLEPSFDFGIV